LYFSLALLFTLENLMRRVIAFVASSDARE
jgi:hypothetical protein